MNTCIGVTLNVHHSNLCHDFFLVSYCYDSLFQAFLDTVLCEPLLANTWEVKRFLDPTTYSDEPHGETLFSFTF